MSGGEFISPPRKTRAGGPGGAPLAPPGSVRIPELEETVVRWRCGLSAAVAAEERAAAGEVQALPDACRAMAPEGRPAVPPAQEPRGSNARDLLHQPRGPERHQQHR